MATKRTTTPPPPAAPARPPYMLIEQIQVKGYKSLVDATLHVRPLTLLAGTNSSGKSSIMQPLLLIKQTMEANYQPAGALVLSGAHVQVETATELINLLLPKTERQIQLCLSGKATYGTSNELLVDTFADLKYVVEGPNFKLVEQDGFTVFKGQKRRFYITPTSTWLEIFSQLKANNAADGIDYDTMRSEVKIVNSLLHAEIYNSNGERVKDFAGAWRILSTLAVLFHIPGLRSLPQRNYTFATFQDHIKGTFDLYIAGTISQWQEENNTEALAQLNDSLQRLGLTNAVTAKVKNANEVELSVNRLPAASKAKPRKADMVNIADVGIGVSQVLPILVALIAAQEGQLVYVEQPELHLHPKAQVAMGELLAEAANRGVRVIVETHSSLLLLTVQTLIAQGKIKNTDVGLHWFTRNAKGATDVQYVQPDEDGAYGAWPEDFSEIELKAQDAYLTAVGLRQFGEAAQ